MKPDVSKMTEQEIVDLFTSTMTEFVDKFYDQITSRYKPIFIKNGRALSARWMVYMRNGLIMDYCAISPGYTKEMAKTGLNLFNEYANLIALYCDVLKFKYPDLEYEIGKTDVSSARIGKCIYIWNFPFKLPDMAYYDREPEEV